MAWNFYSSQSNLAKYEKFIWRKKKCMGQAILWNQLLSDNLSACLKERSLVVLKHYFSNCQTQKTPQKQQQKNHPRNINLNSASHTFVLRYCQITQTHYIIKYNFYGINFSILTLGLFSLQLWSLLSM